MAERIVRLNFIAFSGSGGFRGLTEVIDFVVGKPPEEKYKGTVFLVHGFPDLWYGWRHQIPVILNYGLRVVAIDCMGYGGTDAPRVPPDSISLYGFKQAADDIAELANQLGISRIILGGHDGGGMVVSRVCLYHPSLVQAVFSIGTPYLPPSAVWEEFETMVQSKPNFQYHRRLGSSEFEAGLDSKPSIRRFFDAVYGGSGPDGEMGFSTSRALTENWAILSKGTQLSDKELDYYVEQYARNGMHGPLNWYRNRRQNYEDELPYAVSYSPSFAAESMHALEPTSPSLIQTLCVLKAYSILPDIVIDVPYLFIQSLKNTFFPPSTTEGMERYLPRLRRREVDASPSSHVLASEVVNEHIREWLDEDVFPGGKGVTKE